MEKKSKIYVAGHNGMVGSALVRILKKNGYHNLILLSSSNLDLINQNAVSHFFAERKPDYVFLAAAKVGGIHANNTYRASFLYDNIMIQSNVIHSSFVHQAKKLLFLGSSCIYPKMAPQPLKEEYLLDGPLEPTNEPYALAKIAGIKMCEAYRHQYGCNFIAAMPTNLYGPNDNYNLKNSHVLPALLRKVVEAKNSDMPSITIWGSGKPRREFMHVDDLANALIFLMENYNEKEFINVGTGTDISILELAELIKKIVGYKGRIEHDLSKPDGTPQKLLDVSKIKTLGWSHSTTLEEGIQQVFGQLGPNDFKGIPVHKP